MTGLEKEANRLANSGDSLSGLTAASILNIPVKRIQKPRRISPRVLYFCFLPAMTMRIPMIPTTGARVVGLRSMRKKLSELRSESRRIWAVTVVPIFAPIITPMAEWSFMMPAFTKPTSITVVAEED